ncbi:MAG: hypothetical protein ACYDA1_05530, partial [Vulcanimicrobiaceae bacterium]
MDSLLLHAQALADALARYAQLNATILIDASKTVYRLELIRLPGATYPSPTLVRLDRIFSVAPGERAERPHDPLDPVRGGDECDAHAFFAD